MNIIYRQIKFEDKTDVNNLYGQLLDNQGSNDDMIYRISRIHL